MDIRLSSCISIHGAISWSYYGSTHGAILNIKSSEHQKRGFVIPALALSQNNHFEKLRVYCWVIYTYGYGCRRINECSPLIRHFYVTQSLLRRSFGFICETSWKRLNKKLVRILNTWSKQILARQWPPNQEEEHSLSQIPLSLPLEHTLVQGDRVEHPWFHYCRL